MNFGSSRLARTRGGHSLKSSDGLVMVLLAVMAMLACVNQADGRQVGTAVKVGADGRLVYELDKQGNRLPDFSGAGYSAAEKRIPSVEARVVLEPGHGDDGARIQAAIDYVSGLEPDAEGLRGAVQLLSGQYEIAEALHIRTSGVVLRGMGSRAGETRLLATGTDRRALIQVRGTDDRRFSGPEVELVDAYIGVGAKRLTVSESKGFSPDDRILITRRSPESWIREIGMDDSPARTHYAWKAGKLDHVWERSIERVDGNVLVLDYPLTCSIEERLDGGTVRRIEWPGKIRNVGVESLRCISNFDTDNAKDEEHAWMAVHLDNVEDAWVANLDGIHFASSVVYLGSGSRRVTVMDCQSLSPVSELGGYRRQAFRTDGQQTLFLRCFSENGINDFVTGYLAAGPNVFLECRSTGSTGMSGSVGSWSTGILFDNVHIDGGSLALDNLEVGFGGAGWAAAYSALWQSSASRVVCRSPVGALNWAIGVWGQFWGNGRWQASNEFVHPESLYRAQLVERSGIEALRVLEPVATSEMDFSGVPTLADLDLPADSCDSPEKTSGHMRLEDGWLVNDHGLMGGEIRSTSWWRGHLLPARTTEHNAAITRFLPGRTGNGATDDLKALAHEMAASGEVMIRHHWGLWYDRRREDHQMIRRMTPNVWPPFYEQPWARSGKGTAWDGLSKYDLRRFNPWYFSRLKKFAHAAAENGLVLVNEMYFQHNILESGAHWVDFPWRPTNAIQATGFTEPPPFTGDTIKMAEEFYDLSNPLRRELHRNYIRHCLDNLAGEPNVIHTVGAEYTGPLHFVEFWIDVIAEWIQETGNDPLIALSVPKDVQDHILEDPKRNPIIDIIELKYWWYAGNQTFAPKGGENLAPRQHIRKWRGGRPSAADITRMVKEYRTRYPDKAVIYPSNDQRQRQAAYAGGASLAIKGVVPGDRVESGKADK